MAEVTLNPNNDPMNLSVALNRFNPPESVNVETLPSPVTRVRFGFRVANIGLVVDQGTVSEVMEQLPAYPIPNTPSWLQGVMNVRGTLVPVFDLYSLLEAGESPRKNRMMLMLGKGEDALIIRIDSLPQALTLNRRLKQLPPMPKALKGHIAVAYTQDGSIWLDFDHHSFFTALSTKTIT